MDLSKRDLTLTYGERTFAVRAYRDEGGPDAPGWHVVILEHRTPLRHTLRRTASLEECFAGAVGFLIAVAEARPNAAIAAS